jgi:hypothetical protein
LSWRSSQSFDDSFSLPPLLTVTRSRPVVSFAIITHSWTAWFETRGVAALLTMRVLDDLILTSTR